MPVMPQPLPEDMIRGLVRKTKTDYEGVVAVFLFGSVAEGEWTDSCDLDVEVILDSAEGVNSRPVPFVLNGVPVELHVYGRDRFERAEEIAGTSAFGSHVMNSITIYDPTGFFSSIKSKTANIYFAKRFIQKRVYSCLDIAHNHIRNAERFLSEGKFEFVPCSIHRAINSGIAMALFHLKKSNPTGRLCLSKLESILTEPKEQSLYLRIEDLVKLNRATFESASRAIVHGEKFHTTISCFLGTRDGPLWEKNKHWYNPATRRYIIEGSKMLLQEGKYPASIFYTMMLANSPEIYDQIMPYFAKEHREETLFSLTQIFQSEETEKTKFSASVRESRSIMNSIRTLLLSTR